MVVVAQQLRCVKCYGLAKEFSHCQYRHLKHKIFICFVTEAVFTALEYLTKVRLIVAFKTIIGTSFCQSMVNATNSKLKAKELAISLTVNTFNAFQVAP